jgi:hypothetical protein
MSNSFDKLIEILMNKTDWAYRARDWDSVVRGDELHFTQVYRTKLNNAYIRIMYQTKEIYINELCVGKCPYILVKTKTRTWYGRMKERTNKVWPLFDHAGRCASQNQQKYHQQAIEEIIKGVLESEQVETMTLPKSGTGVVTPAEILKGELGFKVKRKIS